MGNGVTSGGKTQNHENNQDWECYVSYLGLHVQVCSVVQCVRRPKVIDTIVGRQSGGDDERLSW